MYTAAGPVHSLTELARWTPTSTSLNVCHLLRKIRNGLNREQVVICHDMAGGTTDRMRRPTEPITGAFSPRYIPRYPRYWIFSRILGRQTPTRSSTVRVDPISFRPLWVLWYIYMYLHSLLYLLILADFSHHLITIPPASWTIAAHRHGVKVLVWILVLTLISH